MTEELEWEDPPPSRQFRAFDASSRIEAMREHPGKWLVWGRGLSRGNMSNYKAKYPSVEFVSRNHRVIDGKYKCDWYARWVQP